jgi:hypothetical protein
MMQSGPTCFCSLELSETSSQENVLSCIVEASQIVMLKERKGFDLRV